MRFLGVALVAAAATGAMPYSNGAKAVEERNIIRTPGKKPFRIIRNRNPEPQTGIVVIGGANRGRTIPVIVGGPQSTYSPNVIAARPGDVVQFQFSNGNHTVTQSTLAAPCQPMAGGIHSGHIPFNDNQTTVGVFNMPVLSAQTMFLYCATGPHCQIGQVMVINPRSDNDIVNYVKVSQQTASSGDGTAVRGGAVGTIQLAQAAFVPAPPEAAAPPPPGGAAPNPPPSAAPPAVAPAQLAPTTTVFTTVVVPPPTPAAAPAPAAAAAETLPAPVEAPPAA